ncbi:methyltransferase domain-containing protein [Streptomyces thermolineatus]|uniref:Protein-L-isoaspartate O-methyltransferase n=1 Tax=Streptomyces thermolineatus TaxID=44033 RepID=A0ABP5ZP34_9ACTN
MSTATPPHSPAEKLRRQMIDRLTTAGALRTAPWIEAFTAVPREAFVPEFDVRGPDGMRRVRCGDADWLPAVYSDRSLLTQWDEGGTATSSSTEPGLMARMLEALDVADGHRVLEIGVGTGYNAALLSHRLGSDRVVSVDIDPALVDAARNRLNGLGHTPTLVAGDGTAGCPEHGPYDRILATCGIGVPDAWRHQVEPGGVIVSNVGCGLARLTVHADRSAAGRFLPALAAFMSARHSPGQVMPRAGQYAGILATAVGRTRSITLPVDLADPMVPFFTFLVQPDVLEVGFTQGAGEYTRGLVDPVTDSWACISPRPDGTAHLEHKGPRNLWDEREPILTHWAENGRPGPERYGLTITPDGERTLWLDKSTGASWRLP